MTNWNGAEIIDKLDKVALVSIEPGGTRYACRYNNADRTQALEDLKTMDGGVNLLIPDCDEAFAAADARATWAYMPGIGWVC